jgi:hypothetical protein
LHYQHAREKTSSSDLALQSRTILCELCVPPVK